MSIYGRFVLEQQLFVRAVRNGHDVDILEFGAGLAPVTMGENVMPADFASGFDLATRRHRPVKKRVESRDTNSASRRFDVFQETLKNAR